MFGTIYHWQVVKALVERDIFVTAVNPLQMKRYCSQDHRKVKNGRTDAVKIASFGLDHWHKLTPSTYRELVLLSRQYNSAVSLLIKSKLNLGNLLDQVMPRIKTVIEDEKKSPKLATFVKKYIHFEHISSKGETRFIRDFCKWSQKQGCRVDHKRQAKEVFALFKTVSPSFLSSLRAFPRTLLSSLHRRQTAPTRF